MFRNLLWFARRPADEREEALLGRAYRRALATSWCALAVVCALGTFVPKPVSVENFVLLLEGFIFFSIVAGWTVLREEEFEPLPPAMRRPSAWLLVAVVTVLPILSSLVVFLSGGSLYIVGGLAVSIGIYVAMLVWAWMWLLPYTFMARILGTALFSPFIVGFHLRPHAPNWRRVVYSIGFSIVLILPTTVVMGVTILSYTPVWVSTEQWEPALSNGEWTLLDQRDQSYEVGDYVVVTDVSEWRVGRVVGFLPNGEPDVDVAAPDEFLGNDVTVMGTLRHDFPFSDWPVFSKE